MKKSIGSLCLFFICHLAFGQASSKLTSYAADVVYTPDNKLTFVRLNDSHNVTEAEVESFINATFFEGSANKVSKMKSETDQLGFTHIKYNLLQNGIVLANKVVIAHLNRGKLISLNGDLAALPAAGNGFSIAEEQALASALSKVNAKHYKWENPEEVAHMRMVLNDPSFSYDPVGQKMILDKNGELYSTYCFNIYAEEPLYRANVFVDATTGKVLDEQSLLCTTDVTATANTKYSGSRSFVNDYTGSLYRLRETQRGNGIETYNLKNTVSYGTASDFTNATTSWTSTGNDQAATDAHWGAEMTYDYYLSQHNRNSINNAGYKLLSYVHYTVNYTNAFWDGTRMTYGDGNGSGYKIFTGLDVCGHEITHGLTSNTGNLTYQNESGALNECWSDIFGNSIEAYARPSNWSWKIGEDITNGNGLRSMSNPNGDFNPDTYGGTYYYTGTADNGGVHTNSGVGNFWFYLLTQGGTGTNDLNNAYSVTGIGISDAAKIAFRAMTVYFIPSTNYAMARQLTIQAAKDLFGACSNEVIATTKAWYAVGVGANYVSGVGPNFNSNVTNFCSTPANVTFTNTTANGFTYTWDFGDGATATTTNAVHSYTAPGIYSVKLKATGCNSVIDSVTKTSYVVINPPVPAPLVSPISACENDAAVLTGTGSATLMWYDIPSGGPEIATGSSYITPNLTTTTTYYAENTMTVAMTNGGMNSNTNGSYSNSNANYLIFDVLQTGVLNFVDMYTQTAGTRTIQLRNSSNQVLQFAVVSLTVGLNTIPLNFSLTPGTGFRLGLQNAGPTSIYRSTSGVSYPYNIASCVSITGANNTTSSYFYFYKWKVTRDACTSARVPVVVTVNTLPVVGMNAPSGSICAGDVLDLQGLPAGGSYSGSGMNAGLFNAGTAGAGTHTVTYFYTDANSCSGSAQAVVRVDECTGIAESTLAGAVRIYPNPANGFVVISGTSAGKAVITDAAGRIVLEKALSGSDEKIGLETISNGIYFIGIQDTKGTVIKTSKLIKQ